MRRFALFATTALIIPRLALGQAARDPSETPFSSDSVFNKPLGLGAQWESNAQLSGSNVFINTVGNYNENIWKGTASDPLVTITNNASAGGTPGTFQVHIPSGAVPAAGVDQTFSVDDTATHTWYGFGGFNWTGPNTATVRQGAGESDSGSGIQVDGSNWNQGVGTLRQHDLQAGTIDHMLRMELPFEMLKSWSSTSTDVLAPYAWPQTAEDGFAINGNGNPAYSGTVPYGVTIGIPADAKEPADVAANPGADMLWKALQHHGAMIRDSGGSGNTVIFQADQNVDPNDPLVQAMMHFGNQIMGQAKILTNQGPNSINGGGQPIVPLDPPVSGDAGQPSQVAISTPTSGDAVQPAPLSAAALRSETTIASYVTVGEGEFKDAAGNTYSVREDGAALMNGQPTPGGYGTQAMAYENGVVWGQDAHTNIWWQFSGSENGWTPTDTAPDGLPVQTAPIQASTDPVPVALQTLPVPPLTIPSPTGIVPTSTSSGSCKASGTKNFSVSDGRIIDPDGQTFVPQGVSVVDGTLPSVIDSSGNPLLTKFPKVNMVRIAVWGGYNKNDQGIITAIDALTKKGVVVQINNYNAPNAIDAGDMNQESDWIKSWAAAYKGNPFVWFGSKNEPKNGSSTTSSEHKSFYDAVRSTGNNSLISFDLIDGIWTNGLDGSVYAVMRNVSIDAHYYNRKAKYSTDLGANQNALAAEVSDAQNLGHSADGVMPVFIGEWGNSADGANIDPGWRAVVSLVLASGFGQVAWVFFCPGCSADQLTQGGGGLTEFGQMVAAGIAKNATRRPVGCDGAAAQ
jgi:hypothetical protein